MPEPAGGTAVGGRSKGLLAALVAIALAAALGVIALRGSPGATDAARSDAPANESPEALTYAGLERQLRHQPDDARALVLKARLDMQAQRYELAAAGYQKALARPSNVARDAMVWLEYAEARGMLQGGTLTGEPQQLVEKALSIDAANPKALDLAGSAAWERRDFALAASYWRRLLEQMPPGTPRYEALTAAIARAEQNARTQLPPTR